MKKKIVLVTSAIVITAGSLFAFSGNDSRTPSAKGLAEPCPTECCEGTESGCEVSCEVEESSCCMMTCE